MSDGIPVWFGRKWRHIGLKVGTTGIHASDPGEALRCMSRSTWCLLVLLDGSLCMHQGARQLPLQKGEACIFPPESGFASQDAVGLRLLICDFSVLSNIGWRNPLPELGLPQRIRIADMDKLQTLVMSLTACFDNWYPKSTASQIQARAWLDLILTEIFTCGFAQDVFATAVMPTLVEDILTYLNTHIRRHDISLLELAQQCGVSKSHISHSFKKHIGEGPLEYLQRERIAMAAQLLASSPERPIAEIAERCGYKDNSLFAKHFRKHTGVAASSWRQQASR